MTLRWKIIQPSELLLVVLGSSAGPVEGRTALQKLTYFASLRTGLMLGYRPHYYGPYSSLLHGLLGEFVSAGYVEEQARQTRFNRTMYTYSLTDDGLELFNEVTKKEPEKAAEVREVVQRSERIVKNNVNALSWAAKVYFLLSQKGTEISTEEAVQSSRRFGWKLSNTEVESGTRLLVGLGLARRSK